MRAFTAAGNPKPMGDYKLARDARRARNEIDGKCLNNVKSSSGDHGPATDGVLCRRCRLVHRFGAKKGREMYAEEQRTGQRTRPYRRSNLGLAGSPA